MAAQPVSGRKVILILGVIVVGVSAGFAALSLLNIDKIRTSAAVRRSEKPVLKMPGGDMVIIPEGEFQVPPGQPAPPLPPFYIDRDEARPASSDLVSYCRSLGKRPATPQELAKARRGATLSDDISIYGVRGLAAGPGLRCALTPPRP